MDKPTHLSKSSPIQTAKKGEKARQMETADFTKLYRQTAVPVFHYLYSRVNNIQDAEDLTSQTFLTAYEKFPKLRDPKKFRAWVFTIARNKAYDFFRKSQRHATVPLNDELAQTVTSSEKTSPKDKDRLLDLENLIASLHPQEQDYLRLRIVAELTFAEIASILKKPESQIKKRYYRLLDRLQTQMDK